MASNTISNTGPGSQLNNSGTGAQNNYIGCQDQDDQCLRDLRLSDPHHDKIRIKNTKGGLFREASNWILDHGDFLKWQNGDARLLWIKGDPGKGKTMLLITIVEEIERQLKQPNCTATLSYFFCQNTNKDLNNATAVFRGLTYLLATYNRQLMKHLRKHYDAAGPKVFQDENSFYALSSILESVFRDENLGRIYIAIDALDECMADCDRLLEFISQCTETLPRVKWIISSRNWEDIEQKLDNTGQKVRLHLELNQESVSEAVATYIRHKVQQLASLKKYDTKTREAIQRHLDDNADGTFLWVALVCQELTDAKVTRKTHTLSKLQSFPSGLNPLYKRMLEQIFNSNDIEICKEMLVIASVVYRPISLKEVQVLAESLQQEDYDELPQIIKSCGSFLTLEQGIIYFVHQSAKDFLLNQASKQILPNGIAHQHHAIYSKSLVALSKTLRRDIYDLKAPGYFIGQVLPPDTDPLTSIQYSCIYWVDHYCESFNHGGEGELTYQFLQRFYLRWLEALSLMHTIGVGILSLARLRGLLKGSSNQQLSELTQDLYRFIRQNRWVIENYPLQTYISALIFSPTESLVRKLFTNEEPDWIRVKPIVEKTWSPCQQTLEGHGDWVTSVAFSPDSKFVASGSSDNTVKIWEAATGALQQTLEGHGDSVTSVAFSPDSKLLASGSYNNTVKIWEAATGALQQTLRGHDDWVTSVAFSPDSKLLASGSSDYTVMIWEAATGALQQTLRGHNDWVTSVAFSPDSKLLASGLYDNTVKIWGVATGALQQMFRGHGNSITSVAFSPDSKLLASGSYDNTVKIWEAATEALQQTLQQTLEGHGNWVLSAVFSPDSKLVASGSRDKTVKIWEAATGALQQTLRGHDDWVTSVAFSPDSKLLASGSYGNTLKIWEAATGALQQTLKGHGGSVLSVAFSLDSKLVVLGSDDNTVNIWEATTGVLQQTLRGHDDWVTSVAFSPDSKLVASGSSDNTVKVWEAATGALQQTLKWHGGSATSVFSRSSLRSNQISPYSYGITSDKSWISWNSYKILWLPPDYRFQTSAISPPTPPPSRSIVKVALGMLSGKVVIIGFLGSGPNVHRLSY